MGTGDARKDGHNGEGLGSDIGIGEAETGHDLAKLMLNTSGTPGGIQGGWSSTPGTLRVRTVHPCFASPHRPRLTPSLPPSLPPATRMYAHSFAPECEWGANAGLAVARKLLEPVKAAHPWIRWGRGGGGEWGGWVGEQGG